MTNIRKLAIEYWQDDLAKFSPTAKEPHGSCLAMYEAGFKKGLEMAAEIAENSRKEFKHMDSYVIEGFIMASQIITSDIRKLLEKSG